MSQLCRKVLHKLTILRMQRRRIAMRILRMTQRERSRSCKIGNHITREALVEELEVKTRLRLSQPLLIPFIWSLQISLSKERAQQRFAINLKLRRELSEVSKVGIPNISLVRRIVRVLQVFKSQRLSANLHNYKSLSRRTVVGHYWAVTRTTYRWTRIQSIMRSSARLTLLTNQLFSILLLVYLL